MSYSDTGCDFGLSLWYSSKKGAEKPPNIRMMDSLGCDQSSLCNRLAALLCLIVTKVLMLSAISDYECVLTEAGS